MRIIGIDPGLQKTGWGIISRDGARLSFIASGLIKTDPKHDLAVRLATLHQDLSDVIKSYAPDTAAIEETFVNKNPMSTLKLGQARGALMAVPALYGIQVSEYATNKIKKSIVGSGHAHKNQIGLMVKMLLPACGTPSEDEADALAAAICHAHHCITKIKQKLY